MSSSEYIRPFGPNAPWNVPVAGLPIDENSDLLAELLWNDSSADRPERNFNINNTSYTYPVYESSDDTPFYEVVDRNGWGNLGGTRIPFDPSWKAAPGSDGQIIILDPETGREWDLWQASFNGSKVVVSNGNLIKGEGGSDSYFEREVGFSGSRGAGIPYLAMLVRPEEVAAGRIEHALSLPVQSTSGTSYVAPAVKIEFPDHPPGIPEGTRYALDVTYGDIDRQLGSLPSGVSDVTKASLRTIMVAMKDYGWFITDTAGGTHFQLESTTSALDEWRALGMVDAGAGGKFYPRDALDGLFTENRIYAIAPSDEYGSNENGGDGDGDGDGGGGGTGLVGTAGADVLKGGSGADLIEGRAGDDKLYGYAGNDELIGGKGDDLLSGANGVDSLRGQVGDDRLVGGGSGDVLVGGAGNDVFEFGSVANSKGKAMDVIRAGDGAAAFEGAGVSGGDRIDVHAIDADWTTSGIQSFVLGGTGAGHIDATSSGANLLVRANTDADPGYEFALVIEGGKDLHLSAGDFIL